MRVAGFVLVGGRSSRMGGDKARLPVESHLLVEDVAARVESVAGNVALIGQSQRYQDLQLERLDDLRESCGPLGGIETALASGRGEMNLILACDTPEVKTDWLQRLISHALERNSQCVVCRDARGRIQPLCSAWRACCLPQVRHALDSGDWRVLSLIEKMQADVLTIEEPMYNVNTPKDWADWQNRQAREAVSFN